MLRRVKDLYEFTVQAHDGEAGTIDDMYFDDEEWHIRYVVVRTGSWLSGRRVLLAPSVFLPLQWEGRIIPVRLTREQVEDSPEIDLDGPVSRRQLDRLRTYYHWPAYWADTVPMQQPEAVEPPDEDTKAAVPTGEGETDVTEIGGDRPRLRSTREVLGYTICAEDGDIGRVSDLFVDEEAWCLRYLVVDTGPWFFGKPVLIATDWVERVDWPQHCFHVCITREQVKDSPEYDPQRPISRRHERDIHEYYGMPGYWTW